MLGTICTLASVAPVDELDWVGRPSSSTSPAPSSQRWLRPPASWTEYVITVAADTSPSPLSCIMLPVQNRINYLLTPSPQGDLCVAKLFPPRASNGGSSDPGHSSRESRAVRCEASRELKWSIENTGVRSPIYKIINSDDTPLYQISKPNPNADFWTMFYFAYAGHQIPPRRAEVSLQPLCEHDPKEGGLQTDGLLLCLQFGKIQKNPPEKGGGTRITITGKTEDEKRVWQTLGEGNEDCVEWVVCCAALNLLE